MESGLYVVATPIGNLGDISARALEVLSKADLVAAEDTRHTGALLRQFNIEQPMTAYHEHADRRPVERILAVLAEGGAVALVSDAGTPLISDPGYRLVREAQACGYRVIPIPGACAAIAVLSASGMPSDRFYFEGFLPAKAGQRRHRLEALVAREESLIFYEAPHRVLDTLAAMNAVLGGEREAVLGREVTKAFETVRRAPLAELLRFVEGDANQQRGEIVLVVSGRPRGEQVLDDASARLLLRLAEELPGKRAAAVVADITGLRKNQLYQYLLDQQGRNQ